MEHFHGPLAYVICGLLVFGEAAVLLGFIIPGETAALIGGVLASLPSSREIGPASGQMAGSWPDRADWSCLPVLGLVGESLAEV